MNTGGAGFMSGSAARELARYERMVHEVTRRTGFSSRDCRILVRHYEELARQAAQPYDDRGYDYAGAFNDEFCDGLMREKECRVLRRKSKKLTFEEYALGLSYLCQEGGAVEALQFLFQVEDTDGDGKITKECVHNIIRLFCKDIDVKQTQWVTWLKKHFKLADADADGLVNFRECKSMFAGTTTMAKTVMAKLKVDISRVARVFQKRLKDTRALEEDSDAADAEDEAFANAQFEATQSKAVSALQAQEAKEDAARKQKLQEAQREKRARAKKKKAAAAGDAKKGGGKKKIKGGGGAKKAAKGSKK